MTFAARARGNPSHHRRLPALSGIALGYGDNVRLGQMPGVCGRLERKINKASVASELKLPWVCENFGHFASTSGDWRPDCGSKVRVCVCVCVCRDCDSKMRWSLCVGSQLELERWVSVYIAVPSQYTIAVQRVVVEPECRRLWRDWVRRGYIGVASPTAPTATHR